MIEKILIGLLWRVVEGVLSLIRGKVDDWAQDKEQRQEDQKEREEVKKEREAAETEEERRDALGSAVDNF